MSTRRGGIGELRLARGARAHRQEGRHIVLVRQFPDVATDGQGSAFYSSGAPVDFLGVLDGRALAVEVKEAKGKSLPLSRLREDQRALMGLLHDAGADVRLIVGFTALAEVYAVGWPALAGFLAAPWRESWSLAWFRAHGELLPVDGDKDHERVRLLDGAPHPDRDQALEDVHADMAQAEQGAVARAESKVAEPDDGYGPDLTPKRELEQMLADVRKACADGIDRQLRPKRAFRPGRGRQ